MAQPRIGKSVFNKQQLSPAEIAAREQAGIALDAPLTEQEIVAREKEKAAITADLDQVQPEAPAVSTTSGEEVTATKGQKPDINSLVAKVTAKHNEVDAAARARRRAEAAEHVGTQLTDAQSILTKQGILVRKYMVRVEAARTRDWPTLFATVPLGLEWNGRQNVPRNHNLLRRYKELADRAHAGLTSQLSGVNQGREPDPVDLASSATAVEMLLSSGRTHERDQNHEGEWIDILHPSFKRLVSHLRTWVARGRAIVDDAAQTCARFETVEGEVAEMLSRVTLGPVPQREPGAVLPPLERPPALNNRIATPNYDPRSLGQERGEDSSGVELIADGGRVAGGVRPGSVGRDAKTVGVSGGGA